ncbi:hypothetical protein [Streptomyces sp. AC627_RSS907]|uniref:hypothetical protein n=1 Tax=Streptomyces sp. AC627_RSS907 TaxID=2823684 RepID=UPI001C2299B2|nr:hypothetical protein [Streptomyces sp. AC627_RSS907]
MSSLKVTVCAGAALALVLTPVAPAAYAADGGGVSVTPSSPAPGGDVTLRVSDCAATTALATSAAFDSEVRLSPAGEDGELVGSGRIRSTTDADAHAVWVTCGDAVRRGTVTVAERRRPATPTAPASPVAPVDAGGGGAVRLAAPDTRDEARPAPPGTAHTVTGLVLAAIAAVAVALRGVRSRNGGAG